MLSLYWAKTAAAGEMNPIVWRNIFPTFYLFTEPVKEWKSARFPSPFLQNLLLQALARREWTWSFFLWNSTQTIPLSYIMKKTFVSQQKENSLREQTFLRYEISFHEKSNWNAWGRFWSPQQPGCRKVDLLMDGWQTERWVNGGIIFFL